MRRIHAICTGNDQFTRNDANGTTHSSDDPADQHLESQPPSPLLPPMKFPVYEKHWDNFAACYRQFEVGRRIRWVSFINSLLTIFADPHHLTKG